MLLTLVKECQLIDGYYFAVRRVAAQPIAVVFGDYTQPYSPRLLELYDAPWAQQWESSLAKVAVFLPPLDSSLLSVDPMHQYRPLADVFLNPHFRIFRCC